MKTLEEILHGLSPLIGEDLHPDANGACVLVLNETIKIQLELDLSGEFLVLGTMIIDLPPGRFREEVLKAALKDNALIDKNIGILSFITRANQLFLHSQMHTSEISPDRLYEHIISFFHKAENWKNAIGGGKSAPI